MALDYLAIGRRIRALRLSKGITQDDLRDIVNLSKTHMSHIETGTTKLSLPVLVDIANALGTTPDRLLSDSEEHCVSIFNEEINRIIENCSGFEIRSMIEAMEWTKNVIRKASDNNE